MQVVVQYCSITELAPLLDEDEDVWQCNASSAKQK